MHADPDLALADALLGDTLDLPVQRSRRIAGLYAALYLEDPLLHQWGGLAAFVARHIHLAMESAEGLYEGFVSQGNLDIYRATMPAFLRFRRRNDETGPLRSLRAPDRPPRPEPAHRDRAARDRPARLRSAGSDPGPPAGPAAAFPAGLGHGLPGDRLRRIRPA